MEGEYFLPGIVLNLVPRICKECFLYKAIKLWIVVLYSLRFLVTQKIRLEAPYYLWKDQNLSVMFVFAAYYLGAEVILLEIAILVCLNSQWI